MHRIASVAVSAMALAVIATVGGTWLYPQISGTTAVTITGPSMQPTIPQWSLAFIDERPAYAPGDVVTFMTTSTPVTHRIVDDWSGTGDTWLTQGDGNDTADPAPIPTGAIIGRVEGHVPWLGLVRDLLGEPQIIGFLFVLGALALTVTRHPPPQTQMQHAQAIRRST